MPAGRNVFERARTQANLARAKLTELREASDIDGVEQRWSEFLSCHQRFFTRLLKACEHGTLKGWFDGVKHLRSTDDLLKYVHHARNADEHGIRDITEKKAGSVALRPKSGSNTIIVNEMTISNCGIVMDAETAKQIDITIDPASIELVSVVDRGQTYHVPQHHLGKSLSDVSLLVVAQHAQDYVDGLMRYVDSVQLQK